ncbi:hypothetical protein QU38_02445, partial [Staphylococcus aureus]
DRGPARAPPRRRRSDAGGSARLTAGKAAAPAGLDDHRVLVGTVAAEAHLAAIDCDANAAACDIDVERSAEHSRRRPLGMDGEGLIGPVGDVEIGLAALHRHRPAILAQRHVEAGRAVQVEFRAIGERDVELLAPCGLVMDRRGRGCAIPAGVPAADAECGDERKRATGADRPAAIGAHRLNV